MQIKGKLKIERRVSEKTGKEYTAVYFEDEKGEEVLVTFDSRVIALLLMNYTQKGESNK